MVSALEALALAAAGMERRQSDDAHRHRDGGGGVGVVGDDARMGLWPVIGRRLLLHHQWQWKSSRRRWRTRHGSASAIMVLLLCTFSYLIASSLLDMYIIHDHDPEDSNGGGYYNEKYHRRAMLEETAPISTSSSSTFRSSGRMMTVPLLPHHKLHHRKRRGVGENNDESANLIHLRREEEYSRHFESSNRRITRAYDDIGNEVDNDRRLASSSPPHYYETGPLYRGYGTHYIDLYVGSPTPKRRTVVVDTGSSSTAFPCTGNSYVEGGCEGCGMNENGLDEVDGVDDDDEYIAANSVTYLEKTCQRNGKLGSPSSCDFGVCLRSSSAVVGRRLKAEADQSSSMNDSITNGGSENRLFQCRMTASYAEGSTWTAIEASDIVYPFGPTTLNDVIDGDTMEFRLKFGCQTKVSTNFHQQLLSAI
jgi:hypothetical protein